MADETKIQRIDVSMIEQALRTSACLVVVAGATSVGKMFKLTRAELIVGRAHDCDVLLDDDGVSRQHVKLILDPSGAIRLIDLGSTNGTFRNGERINDTYLQDGDKIQIGSTTILKFSYQDALDEALQRNLYDSATRDGLTRIYNKKYLLDALEKELAYSVRHKVPLSLVMLDVDLFKAVNDTHGHPAGDYVLQRIAQCISEKLRPEDIFARYGGEEFAVLLRETSEDKAFVVAERLRGIVETERFEYEGKLLRVTISGGVASAKGGEALTPEALIDSADKLLYRAKQAGRNRVDAGRLSSKG